MAIEIILKEYYNYGNINNDELERILGLIKND